MRIIIQVLPLLLLISGCATNNDQALGEKEFEKYDVKRSFLEGKDEQDANISSALGEQIENDNRPSFEKLRPIKTEDRETRNIQRMTDTFSTTKTVTVAADNMPINDFLHYVFGEVLLANYVLSQDLKGSSQPLTLNIQEPITERQLFDLVVELLSKNQINIDYNNDVFFLQKTELGKAKAIIGIGKDVASVPNTSGQILQVIPVKYGVKISLERTLLQLIEGTVSPDFEQSAVFVLGDRANVLRAIELINLLDVPANKGKHIGLVSLTYINAEDFISQTLILMNNEGLPAGRDSEINKSVSLVSLPNIGAVAVFANTVELLDRTRYWARVLDQPAQGDNQRYFVYNPRYARATDMGESIGRLLTLGNSNSRRARTQNSNSTGTSADALLAEDVSASQTVSSADVSFVVDERSNSIIFSTTGSQFKKLEPLLEKLDVLPKQVMLELVIAEVTLEGEFKFGVEFALNQNADLTLSTLGAFNAGGTGGLLLNYVNGDSLLTASFFRQNSLINVLSNPTLLVRDGVEATIEVGEDIPITGATIVSDNGTQNTSQTFRQTGVKVKVRPTVNAQGVVIMEIDQEISNEVPDTTTGADSNPAVFERALKTEVVAASGQTVLLAGLISENTNKSDSGVPGLADMPLVGNLFKGKDDLSTKTELVMLVTPKVIYNNDNWQKLLNDFKSGFKNIRFGD